MIRINFFSIFILFYFLLYSNLSMASESAAIENNNFDYTIGVCSLVENPPIPEDTAVNSISPGGQVSVYLSDTEKLELDWSDWGTTPLNNPTHGKITTKNNINFRYVPITKNYLGKDEAKFLVRIGKIKTKVIYYFKVMSSVGGTSGYDPYVEHCPNGIVWKI